MVICGMGYGECSVCREEGVLLLTTAPCGHTLYCRQCLGRVTECPSCRMKITKLHASDSDEARALTAELARPAVDRQRARPAAPPHAAKRAKTQQPAPAANSRITGWFRPADGGGGAVAAVAVVPPLPQFRAAPRAAEPARVLPGGSGGPSAATGARGGRTIESMLRDGTLVAGDGVVRYKQARSTLGDLLPEGKLRLPGVGTFNSSSSFAKAIKGKNVSGPANVEVKLPSGSWRTLKDLGYGGLS